MGVAYQDYWYGDPRLVAAQLKAEKIRARRRDAEAWLQGRYVYEAVSAVMGTAFRRKGAPPVPYPERPYSEKALPQPEEASEQFKENERLRATLFFKQWAKTTAAQFHDEVGETGNG